MRHEFQGRRCKINDLISKKVRLDRGDPYPVKPLNLFKSLHELKEILTILPSEISYINPREHNFTDPVFNDFMCAADCVGNGIAAAMPPCQWNCAI